MLSVGPSTVTGIKRRAVCGGRFIGLMAGPVFSVSPTSSFGLGVSAVPELASAFNPLGGLLLTAGHRR